MFQFLITLFGGGGLSAISEQIKEAYQAKLNATTDEIKLEQEGHIEWLKAQQALLIAEQKNKMTSWIRPAIAAPVVILIWKLLVWDTVLGLGVTADPGDLVRWILITVIGAYFLVRPFEKMRR